MTFESALMLLAEKRPEMFHFYPPIITGAFEDIFDWETNSSEITAVTQDDLDEIAALLGWEYEVSRTDVLENCMVLVPEWFFIVYKRDHKGVLPEERRRCFPAKLEAAKAALIAIIQEATISDP